MCHPWGKIGTPVSATHYLLSLKNLTSVHLRSVRIICLQRRWLLVIGTRKTIASFHGWVRISPLFSVDHQHLSTLVIQQTHLLIQIAKNVLWFPGHWSLITRPSTQASSLKAGVYILIQKISHLTNRIKVTFKSSINIRDESQKFRCKQQLNLPPLRKKSL